jgi:hypothetical protein
MGIVVQFLILSQVFWFVNATKSPPESLKKPENLEALSHFGCQVFCGCFQV